VLQHHDTDRRDDDGDRRRPDAAVSRCGHASDRERGAALM
jgi:hypothetical protein